MGFRKANSSGSHPFKETRLWLTVSHTGLLYWSKLPEKLNPYYSCALADGIKRDVSKPLFKRVPTCCNHQNQRVNSFASPVLNRFRNGCGLMSWVLNRVDRAIPKISYSDRTVSLVALITRSDLFIYYWSQNVRISVTPCSYHHRWCNSDKSWNKGKCLGKWQLNA